jgi:tetratricopeptide (TPR) repeat protein
MKKYWRIFSLIAYLVFATLTAAQDMPADAAKAYNEGNKFLKAGNYENAVNQYQEALKTSKDYRIYYQLGITLKKQGKLTEAEDAFNNSIKNKADFDIGYNGLGSAYFQNGKFADAVNAFKKFQELTKSKSSKDQAKVNISLALVKLAESAKKDGNHAKAIEYLNEALQNNQTDAAYVLLATTYYETGDYDKTLATCDQALNMKNFKMKGAAYYYKGMALKQKQILDKAKENFELAFKDPTYKRLAEYELKLLK